MAHAVIALGSNIPPRKQHLLRAVEAVASIERTHILEKSRIYETDPVGGPPQGPFLNAALSVKTVLSPLELLESLLAIEKKMGRVRRGKNSPRIIDLDIIFYDDILLDDPALELPHPRFRERGFVLHPLNDIIPGFSDPETGKSVAVLLEDWRNAGGIEQESREPL